MLNYDGKPFDINDVMGEVDKDDNGNIIKQMNPNGELVDTKDRPINSKGYLVDPKGNVIDKNGQVVFEPAHLSNDEIPKIFPFTKFDPKDIEGDIEKDKHGNPQFKKDWKGNKSDK